MKVGGTHLNAFAADGCYGNEKSVRAKRDSAAHRPLSVGSDLSQPDQLKTRSAGQGDEVRRAACYGSPSPNS